MNQTELYLMITVTGRDRLADFVTLYKDKGLDVHWITLGSGTAKEQMLRYLALDKTEKAVCMSILTGRKWLEVKRAMSVRLRIEAPGIGIAFVVPLSSVAGKRELMFLTEGQDYRKGEEKTLKGTQQELLIAIGNQGYSEDIMDAARAAGARGGTIIRGRGTADPDAEQFFHLAVSPDKEIVMIIVPSAIKDDVLKAVYHEAGLDRESKGIAFSLPVDRAVGLAPVKTEDGTADR